MHFPKLHPYGLDGLNRYYDQWLSTCNEFSGLFCLKKNCPELPPEECQAFLLLHTKDAAATKDVAQD